MTQPVSATPPGPSSAPGRASIEISGLSVRAGARILLENASARFEPGKVTLIVGASGAGKTVLLRLLSGLLDPGQRDIVASGCIRVGGEEVLGGAPPRSIGIVFQAFALLDELSPTENVRFARAHRPRSSPTTAKDARPLPTPRELLDELAVPANVRTSALSGGQRQRLAIARTLAYDPEVLLYDEPTSGLDPATGERVARLLRQTHDLHGKTSVIVTHDCAALEPIADEVYLLDAEARALVPVEPGTAATRLARIPPLAPVAAEPASATARARRVGRALAGFLFATTRIAEEALLTVPRMVPIWKSPYWGLRFGWHYATLVAGPSAWIYLAIAGSIIGFVATYFTFKYLPYAGYTEPLLIENLLGSLGFALYRILVPILGTVLIAARSGAAVASDVGGKVHGQQVDALRSLGARPPRYLLTNILLAFLVGTPVLIAIAFVASKLTSLAVFTAIRPQVGPDFWSLHFHRELVEPGRFLYRGSGWLLAKVILCGVGIAQISYQIASLPKPSSRAVSTAITTSILWSTLYVLVVHFGFAFYEFE